MKRFKILFVITLLLLCLSGCKTNAIETNNNSNNSLSYSSICQQLNMDTYETCGYIYEEFSYNGIMEEPTVIYNDNHNIYNVYVHYANEDNMWEELVFNINSQDSIDYAKTLVGEEVKLCQMIYYSNGEEIGDMWYIENWDIENDIPIYDNVYPYYISHLD